jgi:hypothetical protein
VNSNSFFMWSNFFVINSLMRKEVLQRQHYPLGDEGFAGPLVKAAHAEPLDLTPSPAPVAPDVPESRVAAAAG